jgi:membrane protein insertase Oxa1/YidC/SpoIIIJ
MLGQTFDVSLNWIGRLISWLIGGVGIVGIGIILFSLCLKVIVLPFDVYQRISMRKQNIKMKENQARMEKLQKQYANDKEMYNRKLMEMYRENGISMFSSCLPMILSLVIFIVAINAFNAYSQYANVQNYNLMVQAYNAKIESYCPELTKENVAFSDNVITVKDDGSYIYYTVGNTNKYTEYTEEAKTSIANATEKTYYVNSAVVSKNETLMETEIKPLVVENNVEQAMYDYFVDQAQLAVVETYNAQVSKNMSFLWIKNIWATDASYKHPVLEYADFETGAKSEEFKINGEDVEFTDVVQHTNAYSKDAYEIITEKLAPQKAQANGYYILIVLSIATILLQQFVMMRSQKEQQKFSSVDGQGASQQKVMLVVMTGMFAIFSFMYSSAFSIYMITSNLFSLLSTIVINKIVDVRMAKQEAAASEVKNDTRFTSRIEAAKNAGKTSAQENREKKANKSNKNQD